MSSVEPIVPNYRRKSFNVGFFHCLLENSFSSLLTKIFYIEESKIADSVVVVSNALCFLKNKFERVNVKQLKSALLDFYDIEVVSGAKSQLIEDVEALKSSLSSVKFPYLPRRRDGENRLSREIDDILSLFTFLDEHKLLNMLPRYVADSPDAMPPIRLYEGELNGIISMIKRLGDRFDEYSLVLSTISRDLQLLQARCVAQVATCDQQQQQQSIERSSVGNNKTTEQPSAGNAPDWAVIASTPYVHVNRFDLLRSTDDDEHSDAAAQADRYTTVQSRRGRRRARQL